jgi:hypothetical protein
LKCLALEFPHACGSGGKGSGSILRVPPRADGSGLNLPRLRAALSAASVQPFRNYVFLSLTTQAIRFVNNYLIEFLLMLQRHFSDFATGKSEDKKSQMNSLARKFHLGAN